MPGPNAFLRAFPFAWSGLVECVAGQRNMRAHVVLGILACAFAAVAPLAAAERALLVALVGSVLAAEALNSGIEALVDLLSPAFHERARIAKDAAAGAVLALAAASVTAFAAVVAARAPELWAARAALAGPAAGAFAAASVDALALARPGMRGFALVLGAINLVPCALAAGWGGAAPLALAFALHVLAWRGAAWMARAAPADAPARSPV
jgi:diacylglycerol kinase (ATP)